MIRFSRSSDMSRAAPRQIGRPLDGSRASRVSASGPGRRRVQRPGHVPHHKEARCAIKSVESRSTSGRRCRPMSRPSSTRSSQKYAGRPTDAQVVFSKNASEFVCESVVHLSTGLTAQAGAQGARDLCGLRRLLRQDGKAARRYKRRLKDHHRERAEPVELSARPRISSPRKAPGKSRSPKACSRSSLPRWRRIPSLSRWARP